MTRAQHSGHEAKHHGPDDERPTERRAPGRIWRPIYAARFIAKWEGFSPVAFLDTIAQPNIPTAGYGHASFAIKVGELWSKAKSLAILTKDVRTAARAVKDNLPAKLNFRQRISLISLAYNGGAGTVDGSTLQRKLNAGDYLGAANEFLEWDHAGGVVVQGLLNRRREERWMFLHGNRHKETNS